MYSKHLIIMTEYFIILVKIASQVKILLSKKLRFRCAKVKIASQVKICCAKLK